MISTVHVCVSHSGHPRSVYAACLACFAAQPPLHLASLCGPPWPPPPRPSVAYGSLVLSLDPASVDLAKSNLWIDTSYAQGHMVRSGWVSERSRADMGGAPWRPQSGGRMCCRRTSRSQQGWRYPWKRPSPSLTIALPAEAGTAPGVHSMAAQVTRALPADADGRDASP